MKTKEKWVKPLLLVISHGSPGEDVLTKCKRVQKCNSKGCKWKWRPYRTTCS